MKEYVIRPLVPEEYGLLEDFLYEAIFLPEGIEAPPREILSEPELQIYVENFGNGEADHAMAAEADGKIVGVVWVRRIKDYGYVDDETPSLAIAFYKEYRGMGIGTKMMKQMLNLLKQKGYQKVSLSVQKANYAAQMYENLGFEVVEENDEEYIMVCRLLGEELISSAGKLHTTSMGEERIRKNLGFDPGVDVVEFCRQAVKDPQGYIFKKGKNWYCDCGDARITINSYSYTIITAHKRKHRKRMKMDAE